MSGCNPPTRCAFGALLGGWDRKIQLIRRLLFLKSLIELLRKEGGNPNLPEAIHISIRSREATLLRSLEGLNYVVPDLRSMGVTKPT